MARVKGSYIAKVIIDFDYEEDDFDFLITRKMILISSHLKNLTKT